MGRNCNCDLVPSEDPTAANDFNEDVLENRLIKGQELIYYTKKVQQEIADTIANSGNGNVSIDDKLGLLSSEHSNILVYLNSISERLERVEGMISDYILTQQQGDNG